MIKKINGLRSLPAIAIIAVMTCWSPVATADPITVDFEITGFLGGGELTGWFTGDDSLGFIPGILGANELTGFEAIWSGNVLFPGFTHTLSDLQIFAYNIVSDTLLGFLSTSVGGPMDPTLALVVNDVPFLPDFALVANDSNFTGVKRPDVTTTVKVSEPGTLLLLGIGLLGLGLARRKAA